ncbi:MAG: AMP-binding protein, partial [Lamprobacter sp.]|uniref:AMP-binding protein n=1 Tax=Lamprobacter sp. TaxID=3100796 RepID=UPI002B25DA9F
MLLHHALFNQASDRPEAQALSDGRMTQTYSDLAAATIQTANALSAVDHGPRERVAVYLDKRLDTVHALFGTAHAGGVFVPVNPLLKAEQVAYILRDCNVRILVTSPDRLASLADALPDCPDLHSVLVLGEAADEQRIGPVRILSWQALLDAADPTTG